LESAEAALRREGKTVVLKIYQDAGHAFLADYRPTYREAAAHLLWKDVLDFLEQHIGRGTSMWRTTAGAG
jgi:carboxymethylenebutenolidase